MSKPNRPPVPPNPVSPDPVPLGGRSVLRQRWTELAYLHWRYPPEAVQRVLPPDVTVDTFDGSAWVGLIPFVMRDVRIGPTPPVPYFGTFVEVNVRTYVIDPDGRRSVWFFSLDVPRSVVVGVARTVFSLPYCWARTGYEERGRERRYTVSRRWPRSDGATAEIGFTIGEPIGAGALDHFLTARWSLLTQRRGRLLNGPVAHPRWPLHEVDDVRVEQNLIEAAGLPRPVGDPHTLCSPGVDVRIGWLEPLSHAPR